MNPINIRLPEALLARITQAAEASDLSKNDIIKLALDAGLRWMERNQYDMTKPLSDESRLELLNEIIAQLQALLGTAERRIITLADQTSPALAAERAEPSGYQPRLQKPKA